MVGHQCDDRDQLGSRQQPDRPAPVADPSLGNGTRYRGNPFNRAFRHIRCNRGDAIDALAANAINVDQGGNIGGFVLNQRRDLLNVTERLCHYGDIASRLCRAGTDGLPRAIDLLDDEIGAARTETALSSDVRIGSTVDTLHGRSAKTAGWS